MTTTDPRTNKGARMERADDVAALRRRWRKATTAGQTERAAAYDEFLHYKRTRQKRYDRKPGGLGK